ncbi:MAG: urea ABC transporter permease subunit UrtB [Pseudomonadota bacterium]
MLRTFGSTFVTACTLAIALLTLTFGSTEGAAQSADATANIRTIIGEFAQAKKFSQVEAVIEKLVLTGDPAVEPALRALSAGKLRFHKADGRVFIVEALTDPPSLKDVITAQTVDAAGVTKADLKKVRVKNSIRRKIAAALSGLTLKSPSVETRLASAASIFERSDAGSLEALEAVLKTEENETVKAAFEEARASAILASDRSVEDKRQAVARIAERGDQAALAVLSKALPSADETLKADITQGIEAVQANLALWTNAQNIWYGISLGSVLLLAAIGLAITFGVMGVINMAHGEMVMLGAYTTFVVQELIRASAPDLFAYSLAIALPLAFLVSGSVGLIMERGLIRFLYGRPLETLLATWGVSLILQQAVRSIFGPTNREVGNPEWMSGAFMIGEMSVTWNRLWIVLFALAVFFALYLIINRTAMGLEMRAVTQNRRMAGAMGIKTSWVDALTFALGSGIAGIAGVALSQIGNVSPNLGQSYIIDSFLVVVFGGVGNLWGTLIGALSLGIANKFLEPYAGAVLAKVIILVLIILFIQKRPRGLFALKGRAVES